MRGGGGLGEDTSVISPYDKDVPGVNVLYIPVHVKVFNSFVKFEQSSWKTKYVKETTTTKNQHNSVLLF